MNRLLGNIAGWILPHQVFVRAEYRLMRRARARRLRNESRAELALIAKNTGMGGIHAGQRCFLLCNGPTVRKQNLLPLANETVISVSNGYRHLDFAKFRPRYHCVPQITYGLFTESDVVSWFTEMHEQLGDAELFLSCTEEPLVRKHGLFSGRKVHYVFLKNSFDELADRTIPRLDRPVPAVESVAIMGTMIAMFLGFSDIYLLGTEHDQFKTGTYTYFFERGPLQQKDPDVTPDGRVLTRRYDEFHQLVRLWRQYRILGEIAASNKVGIWNATAGGELDEFPRVALTDLFPDARAP